MTIAAQETLRGVRGFEGSHLGTTIARWGEAIAERIHADSIEAVYNRYKLDAIQKRNALFAPAHEVTSAILTDDLSSNLNIQEAAMLTMPQVQEADTRTVAAYQTRESLVTLAASELLKMQLSQDIADDHGEGSAYLTGKILQGTPYPYGGTPDEVRIFQTANTKARERIERHHIAPTTENTDTLREAVTTLWEAADIRSVTKEMTPKERAAFIEQAAFYTETQTMASIASRFMTKEGGIKFTPEVRQAYNTLKVLLSNPDAIQEKVQEAWGKFQEKISRHVFEKSKPEEVAEKRNAARIAVAQKAGEWIAWDNLSYRSQVRLRARQQRIDDAKLDKMARISKKVMTGAKVLFVLTTLTSCIPKPPPGGTPTPIPVDTRDHRDQTPTATHPVIESPTPLPNAEHTPVPVASISSIVQEANGGVLPDGFADASIIRPAGTGIPGLDLVGSGGATCAVMPGRTDIWFSGFDQIMSSFEVGATLETRTAEPQTRSFTFSDTDTHAASESLLAGLHLPSALPSDWGCSLAIVTGDNPSLPAELNATGTVVGTLFHLNADKTIDTTNTIVFDAGFAPSEITSDGNGGIFVNGKPINFYSLASGEMTTLASAFAATPEDTPVPARPAVLFSGMTQEGGPAQCAQNLIDLSAPNVDEQIQKMFASIQEQAGLPVTTMNFRQLPGFYPGANINVYPLASFYFENMTAGGVAPILTCGEARLGDATARIQIVGSFPFPTADGGTEPIMFGLVHEPKSVELYFQEYPPMSLYTGHIEDTSVFRVLLDGRNQVRLEFYVNDYYNRSPAMQEDWRTFEQKNIGITKSIIVPKLFDMLEQQRFSELFIKVFVNGDRNSANLAELKALIQNRLLPGYINIDEP